MPAVTAYAGLIRAMNVGGTGKMAMADLTALCEGEGLCDVKTYIQSGNVVFTSRSREARVKALLEAALARRMGKPMAVMVRTAGELEAAIAANPFPDAPPNRLLITFFDAPLGKDVLAGVVAPGGERLAVRDRELFVHYPDGMGQSKLKIPVLRTAGTGRNLNTVVKLVQMTRALAG